MSSAVERALEDADATNGAADVQAAAVIDDRDACGVVAAVFEALQPFDQERLGDFSTDVSNDSTHEDTPKRRFGIASANLNRRNAQAAGVLLSLECCRGRRSRIRADF